MQADSSFAVNMKSPVPVYLQIENQVQYAILAGRFAPGDALPNIRELSLRVRVNPNTVVKAYHDLELLHLVHARRGVGYIVAEDALARCRERVLSSVKESLTDAVASCIAAGLSEAEISNLSSQVVAAGARPYQAAGQRG